MSDEIATIALLGIMLVVDAPIVVWMITFLIVIILEYFNLKR